MDIFLLRFFDRVVGVSGEIANEMNTLGIGNVCKIANGIDVDRFTVSNKSALLLEQFGITNDAIVLGMISSLTPEKNHKIVIECLEKLNNRQLILLIVGKW